MKQIQNYIGGAFRDAVGGNWIDDYAPATGAVYAQIPDSDAADIELAVVAAKQAFHEWARMSLDRRFRILADIADGIDARAKELAKAESLD
jgi:aminomuconate-semialdehyde/2-hydroxymuconate-6-semialdehyde dehydrogenase